MERIIAENIPIGFGCKTETVKSVRMRPQFQAECDDCGYIGEIDVPTPKCPKCGAEITSGRAW